MIQKICQIVIFITVLILAFSRTEAAPTTYGPTGLIDMPASDIMRTDQLQLGFYSLNKKKYDVFVLPFERKFEISGALRHENERRSLTTLNVKYNIKQEELLKPGLSVGIDDVAGDDITSVYAVASKALPFGLRLHTGIGTQRYKNGFAGLEVRMIPKAKGGKFPDMILMVEHIDRKTSYGIRMATVKGLQVSAGWRDRDPFWGITYTVP